MISCCATSPCRRSRKVTRGGTVKVVGLLGFDFLAELGVTIDYERKRVTVVPAMPTFRRRRFTPPR